MTELIKGHWSQEQSHPAVLAYLELMAPSPEEYPWESHEELISVISSLKKLPEDRKYVAAYWDADGAACMVIADRHHSGQVIEEGFDLWSWEIRRLSDGRLSFCNWDSSEGGGGSDAYVQEVAA